jgi:hypothetical protein
MEPLGLLRDYALLSEVAADLGVSPRTIRRKINQPNGWPCVTVGGKLRLHVPTIRAIIERETRRVTFAQARARSVRGAHEHASTSRQFGS